MSDPALTPAQLDTLEDALEDLEHGDIEAMVGDDPALASTLAAYRSVLVLAREAMPLEEPRAGLLDEVIAEARRSAATAPGRREAKTPWYRRMRWWGPALAFAGSAALLLVVVRPGMQDEKADHAIASAPTGKVDEPAAAAEPEAKRDDRLADANLAGDKDEDPFAELRQEEDGRARALERTDADKADKAGSLAEPKPEPQPLADQGKKLEEQKKNAAPKKPSSKTASSSSSGAGGSGYDPLGGVGQSKKTPAPGGAMPDPKPAAEPASPAGPPPPPQSTGGAKAKEDVDPWAEITLGDSRRRAGACASAKPAYQHATEDNDAAVRARAYAGLGLCELDAGNGKAAEGLFAKARAADPKVAKFIEAERPRHEPVDQAVNADEAEQK